MITYDWPHEKGGYNLSILTCLRHYEKFYDEVAVLVLSEKRIENCVDLSMKIRFYHIPISKKSEIRDFMLSLPKNLAGVEVRYAKEYLQVLNIIKREFRLNTIVFVHGVLLSRLINQIKFHLSCDVRVVLQSHDCFHIAYKDMHKKFRGLKKFAWKIEQAKLEALEKVGVYSADKIFPITKNDSFSYRQYFPNVKFRPFLRQPILLHSKKISNSDEKVITLIGRIDARKMSGVQHFVRHIFPQIYNWDSSFKLLIAGKGSEIFHSPDNNVFGYGYVDNEDDFILRGRFFVNPQSQGAGLQFKILKAISLGRVVFSTPLSMQGLDNRFDGVIKYCNADDLKQNFANILKRKHIMPNKSQFSVERFERHHEAYILPMLRGLSDE